MVEILRFEDHLSVPIIMVMTYLFPEHSTYIHAGAHVPAKHEPPHVYRWDVLETEIP
jgi:hypothetical protein